jgi:hypothetical protein
VCRRGRRKRPTTTTRRDHDSEGVGRAAAAGRREGETSAAGTKEEADVRRPAGDRDSKVGAAGRRKGETSAKAEEEADAKRPRFHSGGTAASGRRARRAPRQRKRPTSDAQPETTIPKWGHSRRAQGRDERQGRGHCGKRPTPRDHDSKVVEQ